MDLQSDQDLWHAMEKIDVSNSEDAVQRRAEIGPSSAEMTIVRLREPRGLARL